MMETVEIDRTLLDFLDRQIKRYKAEVVALRTERDALRRKVEYDAETLRCYGQQNARLYAENDQLHARLAETMAAMRANGRGEGQG